jgi:hypothetical protein
VVGGWSWATLKPMFKLNQRSRTLLGVVIGAAVLAVPSTALADCAQTIVKTAFKGSVVEYYPQPCYQSALKQLGPDANTYSPNVARNIKAAMRRDRTRKLKFTIQWLPKSRVRVTSNYKLRSGIKLRKGAKVIAVGSISAKTAILKAKKTTAKVTVVLIWKLGKKQITLTRPATVLPIVKKK